VKATIRETACDNTRSTVVTTRFDDSIWVSTTWGLKRITTIHTPAQARRLAAALHRAAAEVEGAKRGK
jgi:hypothetical protein